MITEHAHMVPQHYVQREGKHGGMHTIKAGVQKAVRLGSQTMLRTQHILEHLVYCACHDQ